MTSMPNYPAAPEPSAAPGKLPRAAPPQDVLNSVRLWFASIIIAFLGGILGFALTDQSAAVQKVLDADTSGLTQEQVEGAVLIGLVLGLVFALVVLALEALFVLKMKAGRHWARVVLSILGALFILSSMTALTRGFGVGAVVNLVSLVLLVGAIVLMFRPAANAYFNQPRA